MNKLKSINPIIFILLIGFIARFIFMLSFGNIYKDYYWEYGEISKYILNGNGYSFHFFNGDSLEWGFQNYTRTYPSAFMPPGYVFFVLPFLFIKNILIRNIIFYTIQNLFSLLTIIQLNNFTSKNFGNKVGLIAALIYAITPEFIYLSNIAGPSILYHLGVIIILNLLLNKEKFKSYSFILILSIISVIIVYFRSEFILFTFIIFLYLIFQKYFKQSAIFILTFLLLLLPWQIRNYNVFNEFIFLTSNSGYNFYKGHTSNIPDSLYLTPLLKAKIAILKNKSNVEIESNKLLMKEGINQLIANPQREVIKSFKKILHLWLLYPNDERSKNVLYFMPWFLTLSMAFIGLYKSFSINRHLFSYLFLTYHTLLAITFFVIPRYQTLMKIAILPFAAYGVLIIFQFVIIKTNQLKK
ncbi:MAG: glycosyltransferase family 39 protein [Candidatus Kapabacteria bacterium]|nr:glycosyltransferase family 39 protein [Candidatus Kapabacteria bacterium]